MEKMIVHGGRTLSGEIHIQGAKNAVLPILAACVLIDGKITLENVPRITDTFLSIDILQNLGAEIAFHGNTLTLNTHGLKNTPVPEELVSKMRSSIIFMGSLLGRFGSVSIHYPGGCKLGERAIDLHIKALQALGGQFEANNEKLICNAPFLAGTDIHLDFPSVGATQNAILASVYAKGTTIITNAAAEPEITDLIHFLNGAGAKIAGAGTNQLVIKGVASLHHTRHRIMPDRIVAGTYVVAAAITKSNLRLKGVNPVDMKPITDVFRQMGLDIKYADNDLYVRPPQILRPIEVKTLPHPGFPTDMQPQLMTLLALADGVSSIEETIFEARDMHVAELNRMGARIIALESGAGQTFIIDGVSELTATAQVTGKDLRGGAALILAALSAKGSSLIYGLEHVARGYEDIFRDLAGVGALIRDGYEEEIA